MVSVALQRHTLIIEPLKGKCALLRISFPPVIVILQAQSDFSIPAGSPLKQQARQALQSPYRCGKIALFARPVYHCNLLKYINNRVAYAPWLNSFEQFLQHGTNATGRGRRAAATMNQTRVKHAGFSRDD
ncbi:MAG: hypothetical protein CMQ16_00415 [Gammaproteobacteria bacterium]|nr:hypothetical protein [Gammaproteobacteria bacterium]